jgi:hypothetical protein
MDFFQSLGILVLFNDTSSDVARKRVMASPTNFGISLGIPSGPTGMFLPIFANIFLIILQLTIKFSPELAECIFGIL